MKRGSVVAAPAQSGLPTRDHTKPERTWRWVPQIAGAAYQRVALGRAFTVGMAADGAVHSWGDNSVGALGAGTTTAQAGRSSVALPSGVAFAELSAKWGTVFALTTDGVVYGWGDNSFGQLADGTTAAQSAPVAVPLPASERIAHVEAGYWHGLALTEAGRVNAWGDNSRGQLGNGDTERVATPITVSFGAPIAAISGGGMHSLALSTDGTVYAWGDNSFGQLGDGTTVASPNPVPVALPTDVAIVQVAALANASVALAADGRAFAWGDNSFGQLGDGSTDGRLVPAPVLLPVGVVLTSLSAGCVHVLAVDSRGDAFSWGHSRTPHAGQTTGHASIAARVALPTGVAVDSVHAGFAHSVAIARNGQLYSWGADWAGQLVGVKIGARTEAAQPAKAASVHTLVPRDEADALIASGAVEPRRARSVSPVGVTAS